MEFPQLNEEELESKIMNPFDFNMNTSDGEPIPQDIQTDIMNKFKENENGSEG